MMELTDTFNGLEVEPCGLELNHGPHSHHNGEIEDMGPGAANRLIEVWCEGWGLVTVSFSELDTFRQCFMKHDLAYVQRWSREHDETSALGFGTLWHRLMDVHYSTIKSAQVTGEDGHTRWDVSEEDMMIAVKSAVATLLANMSDEEGVGQEAIDTLLWMYAGHLEVYGLDQGWDIVAVENTVVINLREPDGSNSWVKLKIKLDLVVRDDRGHYWVVDHKSAGSVRDVDHDFDDQFGLYVAALRQQGIKVMGAIHSMALKKPNKGDLIKPGDEGYKSTMKETPLESRFKRTPLNRTEPECVSILEDALADTKLAYSDANHKRRHTNPDTCRWRCDFKEACIFGRRTNNDANVLKTLQLTGFAQETMRH